MNTLELRATYGLVQCVLWRNRTALQLRDAFYPGMQLLVANQALRSLHSGAEYCDAWFLDKDPNVQLVEVPT
jgi:hypothetical protein